MISYPDKNSGKYLSKHPKDYWNKLIRVPSIKAGLSYWGCIGEVHDNFIDWINDLIKRDRNYNDLKSFADYVAHNLNKACGNKPLGEKKPMGVHISGYAPWEDGSEHPFFYHVHNGHEVYERDLKYKKTRNTIPDELVSIEWNWKLDARELFSVHQDFPKENLPFDFNITKLEKEGYVTTNGIFLLCQDVLLGFRDIIRHCNKYDGVSIPNDPNNLNLQTRILMEGVRIFIQIQNFSNQNRLVGGNIKGLSIYENRILDVNESRLESHIKKSSQKKRILP